MNDLIKLQLVMQPEQSQLQYIYEQKNEYFPEIPQKPVKNSEGIGKILTRYKNNKQEQIGNVNAYLQGRNLPVHSGMGLNYSQIYNDLRIDKTPSNLSRNYDEKLQQGYNQGAQMPMSRSPYNFQSAFELGNRYSITNKKVLPGIIVHSSKNNELSEYSKDQSQQQQQRKYGKTNKNFRISDRSEKRQNYQVSDTSIFNIDQSKNQIVPNTNKEAASVESSVKNTGRSYANNNNMAQIRQEKPLSNSRSVGVGNYKIQKKDLQYTEEGEEETKIPIKIESIKKQNRQEQVQEIYESNQFDQIQIKEYNPQKCANHNNNQKNGLIKANNESPDRLIDKQEATDLPKVVIHYEQSQGQQQIQPITILNQSKQTKQPVNDNFDIKQQKRVRKQIQKTTSKNPIEDSRVASTIKPTKEENLENDHYGQSNLNINFEGAGDEPSENILTELRQSQPKQEVPQQPIQKNEYMSTFNIQQYTKIYEVLKSIQVCLKSTVINVQQLLKCIKNYLELIASGNLDNIDQFDIPLHKKKIIKNSLFYERVAIIILAFSYTTHTVKQSLRYLLNIIGYSLTNCLILVKVLQQTQINDSTRKSKVSGDTNQVIQKSDRLAMKRNLDTLRNNNNVLLDTIQKLSKSEETFYENLSHIIKVISKCSLEQTFYNLLEYFSFYLCVSELDSMIPFLAVAPNPYLAPIMNNGKYTLVIDIVQIFCYSTKKSKSNSFRPYSQHFLTEMSQYYEIISFCSAFPNQVDKVIDMLDPKHLIEHRLYKHHTINNNKQSVKYLDRIGRDTNEMILLDNENNGGQGSYDNCIHVPSWKGNKNDTILAQLCPLLAMIALKKIPAPEAASKVRQQSTKNRKQGVKYINFGISLD